MEIITSKSTETCQTLGSAITSSSVSLKETVPASLLLAGGRCSLYPLEQKFKFSTDLLSLSQFISSKDLKG